MYAYSNGGIIWSGHRVIFSGGEEGTYDKYSSSDMWVIVDRAKIPSNVLMKAKIKIYND